MRAASIGQKAPRAATGIPGPNWSPVIAPNPQKGIMRTTTNTKNASSDPFDDVLVFMIVILLWCSSHRSLAASGATLAGAAIPSTQPSA